MYVAVISLKASTAARAAVYISLGDEDLGRWRIEGESGKLRAAELPLSTKVATSWALAAISGLMKVPSQILDFL